MSFFIAPTESADEPRRLRTVWRFLIFGFGYIVLQMILGVVAALLGILWLIADGTPSDLGNAHAVAEQVDAWMVPLTAMVSLPLAGMTLGLCLLCRRFLDRRPAMSMGLVRPARGWTTGILPGFLFGIAPITLAAAGLCAIGGFRFEGFALPVQALYMAPALVFLAFHEEILIRGYLLQNLFDIRRGVFGILFTSLLFWLMHGFNDGAWSSPVVSFNLFGAGVLLALAYQLSGNIWFPTAVHYGWNLAQGVIFSIPVSGMPLEGIVNLERNNAYSHLLTGGEFGLEGSVVISALELLMILLLVFALRSKQAGLEIEADPSADVAPEFPAGL